MREFNPQHVGRKWLRLTCNHHVTLNRSVTLPEVGDEYWCRMHVAYSTVAAIIPPEEQNVVFCESCPYTRNHGTAKLAAARGATQHAQKKPGHVVTVRDANGEVKQTSTREATQESLLDVPDF